jgi:hypothetical protein
LEVSLIEGKVSGKKVAPLYSKEQSSSKVCVLSGHREESRQQKTCGNIRISRVSWELREIIS